MVSSLLPPTFPSTGLVSPSCFTLVTFMVMTMGTVVFPDAWVEPEAFGSGWLWATQRHACWPLGRVEARRSHPLGRQMTPQLVDRRPNWKKNKILSPFFHFLLRQEHVEPRLEAPQQPSWKLCPNSTRTPTLLLWGGPSPKNSGELCRHWPHTHEELPRKIRISPCPSLFVAKNFKAVANLSSWDLGKFPISHVSEMIVSRGNFLTKQEWCCGGKWIIHSPWRSC